MAYTPTLYKKGHQFASPDKQLAYLKSFISESNNLRSFEDHLQSNKLDPIEPRQPEILQINLGKLCNQTCRHCHVDAGPERREIMSQETMTHCLEFLASSDILKVDITGGAPEMNPHFQWFVRQIKSMDKSVIVRSNLTILLTKLYAEMPYFFGENEVEVVSSLPFYTKGRTDAQRGEGVFDTSIEALKLLNSIGYGKKENLKLNLVYNPSGAFLPPQQLMLEKQYKDKLLSHYNIVFNRLYAITNMPISRYLDYLVNSENFETYMSELIHAFNPFAVDELMCRNTLSVDWEGFLYDCDFNQMLSLNIRNHDNSKMHISQSSKENLSERRIIVNEHCFGCTAGSGSSCGGAISK